MQPSDSIEAEAPAEERKRPYLAVFGTLAFLTLIEVQTPTINFIARNQVVAMLIALSVAKATLVVMYYMHLRYEPRQLAAIPLGALILVLVLVLTIAR